jgi:hypothetical protein
MIAPLPGLILTRLSEGIYHHLFDAYRQEFTQYFGSVFEAYVGEILNHSLGSARLLPEREIKRTYKRGKLPDYVMVEGSSAILIECKAIGLQRKALAMADESSIDHSVSGIVEGLIQLHEFKNAWEAGAPGLEALSKCSEVKFLIVTLEPFYLANSVPFKELIEKKLQSELHKKGIRLSLVCSRCRGVGKNATALGCRRKVFGCYQ